MKQNTFCRLLLMAALLFCTLSSYAQSDAVNSYGLVDDLTYSYNGNQLTKVTDAVTSSSYTGGTNFIDGANVENEYVYDANGNLTKDLNKGIANITYNSLNLPSVVTFSDGNTITYTYAYDSTKLRTVYVIDGETTTIDYCGNVIYENGTVKRLLHDEGFVDLTTNTCYYYLKDHQGNNRVVIDGSGNVVETNDYYPFGGLFATNSDVQPYKYNGKELDTKKGLNLYDYGARHYDAALGRFTTIDPLAEKDYLNAPYNYCGNNPIVRIDRDGKIWDTVWDFGNLLYDVGAAVYSHIQGDHAQAQSHWKDAGADALAMAVPIVPAGVTKLKYADDVVDAAKATNKADNATDITNKLQIVIPDKDKIDRNLLNPPTKPGNAPTFKSDGSPVEIHHVGQDSNGPFIELNVKEHRGKGFDKVNHPNKRNATNIDRNEFNKAKKEYWKNEYQDYFNQQNSK